MLLGDPSVWREISEDSVPDAAPAAVPAAEDPRFANGMSFRAAKERAIAEWEREYVRALSAAHEGNLSRAARAVRMDRNHLRELLVRHRIRVDDT